MPCFKLRLAASSSVANLVLPMKVILRTLYRGPSLITKVRCSHLRLALNFNSRPTSAPKNPRPR